MFKTIHLPETLNHVLDGERKDFAVKSARQYPLSKSVPLFIFGSLWLGISSTVSFAIFYPLLQGEEYNFFLNDKPVTASLENLEPMIFPAIFIGVFLIIGLVLMANGISSIFKKGGYFVGTPSRLVIFIDGKVRSIDWEQFSGNIILKGNAQKGNLSLELRTIKMISHKNNTRYTPEVIYMEGIKDIFNIEKICRRRIKENDPTPARTPNIPA
jgi:hypothetical protein